MRPIVAIIGNGGLAKDDARGFLAHAMGRALVDAGYRVACSGLGGIMESACLGASSSPAHRDGDVIGILPGFDPSAANEGVDIALATGLDQARNFIVANSDAVIAIGGGAGTLSEMAAAWQLQRLLIAFRVQGWSGRMADTRIDERCRYPDMPEDRVHGADTPQDAIDLLRRWLPKYDLRHPGIPRRRPAWPSEGRS